ncbi:MAG: diheme cytochrome c [Burkholderiaceae bacterium]
MSTFTPTRHAWPLAAASVALFLSTTAAWADGGRSMPASVPAAYVQECAACHTAYPPGLLPASSWQRIMDGLDRHYGTDASLDAATVKQIGSWLQTHAGTYRRVTEAPAQDRITRSAWFERKHRQIDAATWALPSVKSAANCAACHTRADQGDFDDDHLRFPAGLSLRQRLTWHD